MHHSNITIDTFDHFLLTLLDGKTPVSEIQKQVESKLSSDIHFQESLTREGKNIDAVKLSLQARISQSLYFFALNGLLD